jgi:23S rRNA (adenine2503-C2)-methyltransferase
MEIYKSNDGLVTKYIHDDGSETAVKNVPSCDNEINILTGDVIPKEVERNKFSVFISSSVGCPIGCKFCYLTTKKYPYHRLHSDQVTNNVKEALRDAIKDNPSLKNKYIKLGFMGMGDILLFPPQTITLIIERLVEFIIYEDICLGIDSIDLATTLPNIYDKLGFHLNLLDFKLNQCCTIKINPEKRKGQSLIRLFYSNHSCINRGYLIPSKKKIKYIDIFDHLKYINNHGIDIIIHQILLKDVNDNENEIYELKRLIKDVNIDPEIRILRFNKCSGSMFKETDKFNELVKMYSNNFNKIKYQVSAGSEIKASCGQFICKQLR